MVLRATVLPPVLGPEMTRARKSLPISTEIGTTSPLSSGCRGLHQSYGASAALFDDLGHHGGRAPAELGLGQGQVDPSQALDAVLDGFGLGPQQAGELAQDSLYLVLLGDLELAPGVALLDGGQGLHEHRGAAARDIVNEPLERAAVLGLHRQHVAVVPGGDEGLLQDAAPLDRGHELFQPPLELLADGPLLARSCPRSSLAPSTTAP